MHSNRDFNHIIHKMYRYRYLIFILLQFVTFIPTTKQNNTKTEVQNGYDPLIATLNGDIYQIPDQIITIEGQTQKYHMVKNENDAYFCPMDEDMKNYKELMEHAQRQYCVVKKPFKQGEKQKCTKEVKPLIIDKDENLAEYQAGACGLVSDRRLYSFAYEICTEKTGLIETVKKITHKSRDILESVQFVPAYQICYDHSKNRVHFTKHKLKSAKNFHDSQLSEEKATDDFSEKYSIDTYGLTNLENLRKTLTAYNLQSPNHVDGEYQLQMLVPSEHFAAEHWKKTTFHMINYAPLHRSKVALWKAIDLYIRSKSTELFSTHDQVEIWTGTVGEMKDINENLIYLGNDQHTAVTIPELWWKVVYASHERTGEAIVIIMNNINGLKKICQEKRDACEFKKWNIPIDKYTSQNLYCCHIADAEYSRITAITDTNIAGRDFMSILKLD